MKFNTETKYLVVTHGDYTDYKTILNGDEVEKWLTNSSIKEGDRIYELAREYEVGSVKVVKEKKGNS